MFSFRSRYGDIANSGNIRITLSDGTTVNSSDVNSMLSTALGKEVKFIAFVARKPVGLYLAEGMNCHF